MQEKSNSTKHIDWGSKNLLWTEVFRPKTLEHIILPNRIKEQVKDGLAGNYLFYGSCGIGKSTLAFIMAKGYDVKIINASLENSVDDIRNTVVNFCTSASFKNSHKLIFLDEADHLSVAAQAGLRGTIEKFHMNARFIFTCNYPEKIIEPVKSRLREIDFNFTDEENKQQIQEYAKRIRKICETTGMEIEKEAIQELLKQYYPDLRKIVDTLQFLYKPNRLIKQEDIAKSVSKIGDEEEKLFKIILGSYKPQQVFKFLKSKYQNRESEAFKILGTPFTEYLATKKPDKMVKVSNIMQQYAYEYNFVIDKFNCLYVAVANVIAALKG